MPKFSINILPVSNAEWEFIKEDFLKEYQTYHAEYTEDHQWKAIKNFRSLDDARQTAIQLIKDSNGRILDASVGGL